MTRCGTVVLAGATECREILPPECFTRRAPGDRLAQAPVYAPPGRGPAHARRHAVRPRTKILLEASTESEWVARHLESLGHEVLVADPNYAPMYATRSRRTKTDRRDARTLMDACQTGAYRLAHRLSEPRRHVRAELAVREALVRTRTRYVALAKTLVRRDGLRVASRDRKSSCLNSSHVKIAYAVFCL